MLRGTGARNAGTVDAMNIAEFFTLVSAPRSHRQLAEAKSRAKRNPWPSSCTVTVGMCPGARAGDSVALSARENPQKFRITPQRNHKNRQ